MERERKNTVTEISYILQQEVKHTFFFYYNFVFLFQFETESRIIDLIPVLGKFIYFEILKNSPFLLQLKNKKIKYCR